MALLRHFFVLRKEIFQVAPNKVKTKKICTEVIRDVRYSNSHPNNILDIYTGTGTASRPGEASKTNPNKKNNVVLYLHGGSWMKGSKDDSFRFKSKYDLVSTLLRYSLHHDNGSPERNIGSESRPSSAATGPSLSNIGLTFASQGITTYVANYRLIDYHQLRQRNITDDKELGDRSTENQVLDVARAIIYVLMQHKRGRQNDEQKPNIYIVGYSAGAHLSALALSQNEYLQIALEEYYSEFNHCSSNSRRESQISEFHHQVEERAKNNKLGELKLKSQNDLIQEELLTLLGSISGFVGISGPYNLSRLDQSPLRDITIGPVFQETSSDIDSSSNNNGKEQRSKSDDNNSLLMRSSPLHVILRRWKKYKRDIARYSESDNYNHCHIDRNIPLIAKIPVLLLNAENDFHLQTDSKELLVALSQFHTDSRDTQNKVGNEISDKDNQSSNSVKRQHFIIQDRNHLDIAWDFGSGYYTEENTSGNYGKTISMKNGRTSSEDRSSWKLFSYYDQASSMFSMGKALLLSSFYEGSTKMDRSATEVFKFMNNEVTKR